MKRLLVTLILIIPMLVMAQDNSPIDKLFNKYANKDGFTKVNISGKLLSLANSFADSKDDEIEMLNKISGIRVLSVDDSIMNTKLNFYKELESDGFFKNNKYEVLMLSLIH